MYCIRRKNKKSKQKKTNQKKSFFFKKCSGNDDGVCVRISANDIVISPIFINMYALCVLNCIVFHVQSSHGNAFASFAKAKAEHKFHVLVNDCRLTICGFLRCNVVVVASFFLVSSIAFVLCFFLFQ